MDNLLLLLLGMVGLFLLFKYLDRPKYIIKNTRDCRFKILFQVGGPYQEYWRGGIYKTLKEAEDFIKLMEGEETI